jgi:alkanesulfonate monooxygenase SsuD/methylene tetrahydromethanopterin reductase-like flavin-dependent oxidoreductase (luciferase family)
LGAGWSGEELRRTGQALPSTRERAERLVEAVQIVRGIFDAAPFAFEGKHYSVDLGARDHAALAPPTLVASVGGAMTLRGVAPFVDRLELKVTSVANRGGVIDPAALAAVSMDDLRRSVAAARDVRPDVPLGLFVLARARDDDRTRAAAASYPTGSLIGRAWGEPKRVFDNLVALEGEGISRVHVSAVDEATYANLGALLATR